MEKVTWIYESPDNGKTLYRRKFLSTERELLVKLTPKKELKSISEFLNKKK
jgi:hypothetical protein